MAKGKPYPSGDRKLSSPLQYWRSRFRKPGCMTTQECRGPPKQKRNRPPGTKRK